MVQEKRDQFGNKVLDYEGSLDSPGGGDGVNFSLGGGPFDWIFKGLDLLDRGSSFGKQQDLDSDYFDRLMRNAQQQLGTLQGFKDDINDSFAPAIAENERALDPRINSAQRTATLGQLQHGLARSEKKLEESAAARGVSNSGATDRNRVALQTGFQDSVASFDAAESAAEKQRQLQLLDSRLGKLGPIVMRIAQLQGAFPNQRERAPGAVTGALSSIFSGDSPNFGGLFGNIG